MRRDVYEAYAIYADQPAQLGVATEMEAGLVPRIFNIVQSECGDAISRVRTTDPKTDCTVIRLAAGMYRISGFSILTMDDPNITDPKTPGCPPVLKVANKFPGYALVYNADTPPQSASDMTWSIDVGSISQAYDTSPSLFDTVAAFTKTTNISVGHQCTYTPGGPNPVYIRIGTKDSLFHTFAKVAILKIG
jgi:hypothetical protein